MPGSAGSGGSGQYGVVATRHFESGPPPSKTQLCSLDDGEVYETVKEEEWLTRKKVTKTTTKNIETRTQRNLVLEDGEIVEDTGPVVTTDCKEDTVTQEVNADENLTPEGQVGGALEAPGEDWVPVGGAMVVSEKTEHILNSHQVAENKRETEEVQHCGDVTNKEVEDHVVGKSDLRALTEARQGRGWELAKPEKRVVHESAKKWGTVDTEDVRETSRIKDGHVVTETERTTQKEQYDNESVPDSGSSLSDGSVHEETRQASHNIVHTKDEDLVEYYGVPRGAPLAQGVKLGEGMHVVSEDFHEDREGADLDSLSERCHRARRLGAAKQKPRDTPERTDALTRKPLDYHQEEETRKSETNRWLENHFGSESGRSGSSHNDLEEESGIKTSGGNVIHITMSPRPATPEDVPDAAPPRRRWESPSHQQSSKAPPPPPPPKPSAVWTPTPPSSSPRQSAQSTQQAGTEEITDTMIAAARARLRSTGRVLDEEDQSPPPTSPLSNTKPRYTTYSSMSNNAGTYASPPVSPTSTKPLDDPVFSSKFRSGSPSGFIPGRLFSTPARNSRIGTQSPPDSPPPPLPSTPPPNQANVGRSQSFNVTNKSWMNGTKTSSSRPYQSRMKEYRSEEQLDSVGHKPSRRWPPTRREASPSPPRETTSPPPPPRHRSSYSPHTPSNYAHYNTTPARSHRSSRTTEIATQTLARDSATQTGPSPVPPPRTKRKNKPKTYYFGQDSSYSESPSRVRAPVSTSTTTVSYTSTSRHNQSSPKIERRFKTTKTITPVVVATPITATHTDSITRVKNHDTRLKNKSWHYRSMDELSSGMDSTPQPSWTNTVDPRRRPRNYSKEPEIKTLPKKLVNGTHSAPSPSKTYIFGSHKSSDRRDTDSSTHSSHLRRNHGGSLINVSLAGMSSPKSVFAEEIRDKQQSPSKPVLRSHSLNVKPGPLTLSSPAPVNSTLTSQHRTSTVYRSSPYLNLRSPNLIATIARSNSTRRTDENDENEGTPVQIERYRSSYNTARSNSTRRADENEENEGTPVPIERYRSSYNNSHSQSQKTHNTSHTHNSYNNSSSQRLSTSSFNAKNSPVVNGEKVEEEKRDRFMKGLLTTAPELFNFLHGEEDKNDSGKTRQSPPESPPQLIRPPSSPLTSPKATSPDTTAPRIFTFGRGENGSLKRTSSLSQDAPRSGRQRESITSNHMNSDKDYGTGNQRNSLTSQYHRNAQLSNNYGNNSLNRPKFNLKSSGGSVSTSFRNRSDPSPAPWGRRGSDPRDHHDIVGEKHPGTLASNITRDGAVLIPIRDWNSR